jgi:hypothetical protein
MFIGAAGAKICKEAPKVRRQPGYCRKTTAIIKAITIYYLLPAIIVLTTIVCTAVWSSTAELKIYFVKPVGKICCDALRCSGPHARYTDRANEFITLSERSG